MAFFVDSADCESQLRRKERPMAGAPAILIVHSVYSIRAELVEGSAFLYAHAKSRRDASAPRKATS
jgi:hypothetical protein